jgi:hypothetical protein
LLRFDEHTTVAWAPALISVSASNTIVNTSAELSVPLATADRGEAALPAAFFTVHEVAVLDTAANTSWSAVMLIEAPDASAPVVSSVVNLKVMLPGASPLTAFATDAPPHVTDFVTTIAVAFAPPLVGDSSVPELSVDEVAFSFMFVVTVVPTPNPEKIATPAVAVAVRVPLTLPSPSLFDRVMVRLPSVVAMRPDASMIFTIGCVVHTAPARHPEGAVVIHTALVASCTVIGDELTVIALGLEMAAVSTRSVLPLVMAFTPENTASPATAD